MKLNYIATTVCFLLLGQICARALTVGFEAQTNVYGNLWPSILEQRTGSFGVALAEAGGPGAGLTGLAWDARATAPNVGTQRAYAGLTANGTTGAAVTSVGLVDTNSLWLATNPGGAPGAAFASTLDLGLDGDLQGVLQNLANINSFANLTVSLNYNLVLGTPDYQTGPTGSAAVQFNAAATLRWNSAMSAFDLEAPAIIHADHTLTPLMPGGIFPGTPFALTNGSASTPNGFHFDISGSVPWTAVEGQTYVLSSRLSVQANYFGTTAGVLLPGGMQPSNDFKFGAYGDFTHTATSGLVGSGGGSFQLIAVPEPATAALGLLACLGLLRRKRSC